jgi:hypothetical protein
MARSLGFRLLGVQIGTIPLRSLGRNLDVADVAWVVAFPIVLLETIALNTARACTSRLGLGGRLGFSLPLGALTAQVQN